MPKARPAGGEANPFDVTDLLRDGSDHLKVAQGVFDGSTSIRRAGLYLYG